ncbi:hypothetical protein RvY_15077-2 [Ramazzottius varieornatus]|uniref:Chromo domain-containing protein n=1 Tax=Ramazzottius varieornatus TaxID=947166 RepID=A0A1D1VTL7_RAMVA|nr:hypothetical protein RvY_15077-2 [Ramazzottius varieornatus]
MSDSESDEPSYEVAEVLDTTGKPPNREFFVKWKGYDESENSWEPEENMYHLVVVQEYVKRKGLAPVYDPEKEEERKNAEREREREKQRKREKEKEVEGNKKKQEKKNNSNAGSLSDEEVKRRWAEEVERRRRAAKEKEQDKPQRRAGKQLSTKEQKLAEKQKDELLTKQLESEGWKGFELYKEKSRRKEIEENGGVVTPIQPPATSIAKSPSGDSSSEMAREKPVHKPKPKPAPAPALDYSSDEEIPMITATPRKAPSAKVATLDDERQNTSAFRDSSPEIPVIKSAVPPRPRPKRPVSSSSSSDEAPGPVGSSKAMAASAARQPVEALDSSSELSDSEDRKKKDEEEAEEGEPTYAVRKVLDMRGKAPDREFLVQWEGYDSGDDTWEPEEGVGHLLIVQKFIADRAAWKVASSAGKSKKRDYSGTEDERTRKKEKDGKYGHNKNFFNQPSSKASTSYKQPNKYGPYSKRGGKVPGDIYDEGAGSPQNVPAYPPEDEKMKKKFLASSFRIPKAKGGDGRGESVVELAADGKASSPDDDYANDEEILEGGLNDDVAMTRMVLGLEINHPDPDRKPDKFTTKLLDDELIDSITRPVDDNRFDDLYKRLQFLRIECSSKFSQELKVPAVTAPTHMFETAIPRLENQGWHRPVRTREMGS